MVSEAELIGLIEDFESDSVEKTISTTNTDKFGEVICSFSNDFVSKGLPGYLIIGVNDDGSRVGLSKDERMLQNLMDFRTNGNIVPPPLITTKLFEFSDGCVYVVEVQPSYQPPVRFKGKVCIRVGPRKGTASEMEERVLSEKRSSFAHSWDTLPCYGSSLEDISVEIFKLVYLPTAIDKNTLDQNGRELKNQLASLKFYDLKSNLPTNVAILMFGTNPCFYLPGAYIQYVRFIGNDETSEFEYENKFSGDLTTQMRTIEEFIKSQIIKKVLIEIGEKHLYNFPISALKELVFNAIIHRDYQSNAPIKFYEFDDRITISNAGGLFGMSRPENFPNQNDYRNPSLAEAVYNLGYVNRFNLGIKRAKEALTQNGNPEPRFVIDQPTHFEVSVFKKKT